jgi:hypothetical protein
MVNYKGFGRKQQRPNQNTPLELLQKTAKGLNQDSQCRRQYSDRERLTCKAKITPLNQSALYCFCVSGVT